MAKAKSKSKKILKEEVVYTPPPEIWYFYIGEKYYRRLQPIPFKKSKIPDYINEKQGSKIHPV